MKELFALIRHSLGRKSDRGSQVSIAATVAMVMFGFLIFFMMAGGFRDSFRWYWDRGNDKTLKVVVVNAPQSWFSYENSLDDEENDFEFYHFNHQYIYDISTFTGWMKDTDSVSTIVFSDNEVLTFYRVDDLSYSTQNDYVKDKILGDYSKFISDANNSVQPESDPVKILEEAVSTRDEETNNFSNVLALLVVPIVYFIAILYAAMCNGTYLVAGAKENGSFSSILMTPVSRFKIVLGFTIGVWLKTMVPVTVITLPLLLIRSFWIGIIPTFIHMSVLAFFVSSIVVMISTMNNTIVSAQTTFLPIFLIFVVLAITLMQDPTQYDTIYYYFPLYGQYLGASDCLLGNIKIIPFVSASLLTISLSLLIVYVSNKLLLTERFTISTISVSNRELAKINRQLEKQKNDFVSKPKISIYGYRSKKRMDHYSFVISQVLRPLIILSVFQLISLIPPLLLTSGSGLTDIMLALKTVNDVPGVIKVSADIIGVLMNSHYFLISMGLGYVLMIIVYILRVKFLEKDTIKTMGFGYKKQLLRYLVGLPLGLVMISLVYVLLLVTGQIRIEGFGISSNQIIIFLAYISMWIPQGATEEIMFRGYMMPRVASRYGLIPAIILSSVLFTVFHGMNPGFSILALINLMLISLLYALIAYYSDNIWTLSACHSMWNFTQGNIFGLEVSGNSGSATLIHTVFNENASDLWTGGGFGPEGGLAVTLVTCLFIALVIIFRKQIIKTRKI